MDLAITFEYQTVGEERKKEDGEEWKRLFWARRGKKRKKDSLFSSSTKN